jgi:hypothetical protein
MNLALKLTQIELEEFIVEYYPHNSTKVLSVATGLSASQVSYLAYKLGLKKSDEYRAKMKKERSEKISLYGKATRFKKGNKPVNKGNRMPSEAYAKCQATMFKKGNKPHNYNPIGTEKTTEDGYIKVKTNDPNVWEFKHRLVWEQANGPIPKGFNVQFKDKNRANVELQNLYLISRAEQIDQNTILRYPAEVRKAIRAHNKLTKTIKQHETD